MKIAFVHQPWDFANPPVVEGSLSVLTTEIARRLVNEHEVIVFGNAHPHTAARDVRDGVRYQSFRVSHDRLPLHVLKWIAPRADPGRPHFSHILYYLIYALKIALAVRRERCDVVHIHNFSNFAPVIRRLNPRARIVLHMHCEWLTQIDSKLLERRLRNVDAIVSCGEYITENTRRRFPAHADKCRTVVNGVDPAQFGQGADVAEKNGHDEVLFVGRISPEKAAHTLIDAFAQVSKRHPRVRLRMVGPQVSAPFEFIAQMGEPELAAALAPCYEGDYLADLRRRAALCGEDRVDLAGPAPHDELPALYAHADILVNPSLSEPFGMTVVEAMASGTPVVATRVGGMKEILAEQEAGILVEPNDAAALADAITRLIEDPDLRRAMGAAGRRIVQDKYTWDHVADAFRQIYESGG